jgi:predicted extracellular nuclease
LITTPIDEIQGNTPWSPLAGKTVWTRGVVTGHARRGFFIQNPNPLGKTGVSDAVFVYSPKKKPPTGSFLALEAIVVDYLPSDNSKPVTQLKMMGGKLLKEPTREIIACMLRANNVPLDRHQLAVFLNGLEGMLVAIEPGATFIQASNPFGDYVVSLADDLDLKRFRTHQGGIVLESHELDRWFPSFRMINYVDAPRLNVGARLLNTVTGPLNFRSGSYQISVNHSIEVEPVTVAIERTSLAPTPDKMTILTLNSFNLDPHVELAENVKNPHLDIDDDYGDRRFHALADAVVTQAETPDIIALQEIQDSDGAEITKQVAADKTYQLFTAQIRNAGGPTYHWIDIAPVANSDGGQPGGNIRNAYLYNPERIELIPKSAARIGEQEPAFENSRKPLMAHFRLRGTQSPLAVINVHLASKRHQNSIFAPLNPGFDPQLATRIKQASIIRAAALALTAQGIDYYITGDFNDFEDSSTLKAILGDENVNLVKTVPRLERYDYNHRGKLQVLMHGIVSKALADAQRAEYEILHGNELIGVRPGELGTKPSDHAYVISRIKM